MMKGPTPFFLTATAAFALVVVLAGVWIGLAQALPGADRPGPVIAVVGALFSVAFMWLLIMRLRRLLAEPDRRWREVALLLANFAVLVFVFAWIHSRIGLMDQSMAAPVPTHDLADALYFSIVTITTVGYGDFLPIGVGRAVAAMQGLVGYFILGILVSTGFQLLAPDRDADRRRAAAGESR